ncbi:MAG: hypothetical protein JWO88_2108 [Frankiales bacterium]|nr:hypothetical protein [Frankiales bacterium]
MRRAPKPVLLLLLALAALFAPAVPQPSASAPVAGIARAAVQSSASATPVRGRQGIEHRDAPGAAIGNVAAPNAVPMQSTPASDARLSSPRLALVQRPRPPTARRAGPRLEAPTGRSPPPPAGT